MLAWEPNGIIIGDKLDEEASHNFAVPTRRSSLTNLLGKSKFHPSEGLSSEIMWESVHPLARTEQDSTSSGLILCSKAGQHDKTQLGQEPTLESLCCPLVTSLPTGPSRRCIHQAEDRTGTPGKRASTFYSGDATDVGTPTATGQNLEQILNETPYLAGGAAALKGREHVTRSKARSLWLCTPEIANRPLPCIHENIRGDPTDDSQEDASEFCTTTFLGAAELSATGCKTLPSRSIIRRRLAPSIHSSNVTSPALPPRTSSLCGAHKLFHTALKNHESSLRNHAGFQRMADTTSDFKLCVDYDMISNREVVNAWSLDGGSSDNVIDFSPRFNKGPIQTPTPSGYRAAFRSQTQPNMAQSTGASRREGTTDRLYDLRHISLKNRSHVSLTNMAKFSLTRSVKQEPIARN